MSDTTYVRPGLTFTSKIEVSLIDWMGRDQHITRAARVSTKGTESLTTGGSDAGLIDYLMKSRHGSPFEHNCMTFLVTAPLAVWAEHMRHRIGFSYNQESARYKVLDGRYYLPEEARTQQGKPGHYVYAQGSAYQREVMRSSVIAATEAAHNSYHNMLEQGIAREQARWVLPVNTMSSAYVTLNARSMMSFLSLRTNRVEATFPSKPMAEIEAVAEQYENHFSRLFPLTWKAFDKHGRVAP